MRTHCKGYWLPSTPDYPEEFYCGYEHDGDFDCGDCICNGGAMSPVSGKPFRGNREPYIKEAMLRWENRNNTESRVDMSWVFD